MARASDPRVRRTLVEQAAAMLAAREQLTLRAVADRSSTSTMAVYTHFGGMPGLRQAVRMEGFRRLVERLDGLDATEDPVHDLAALGAAYVAHGVAHPHLYRAMFDTDTGLGAEEEAEAGDGLGRLVAAAARAVAADRFDPAADPGEVATRLWAAGHGLLDLVMRGVLPPEAIAAHGEALVLAACLAAGDDPARGRVSVRQGWASAAGDRR